MARYEIYVVDPVRAALWWGAPISAGTVVSEADSECPNNTAGCQACGTLHGIAHPEILEKNGLAARKQG